MATTATAEVMAAIARVRSRIERELEKYSKTGEVVAAWESIFDGVLRSEPALSWVGKFRVDQIGVHPKKRGGLGCSVSKAFANAEEHIGVGYSLAKAQEGAWAFQTPRGGEAEKDAFAFNDAMTKSLLPPLADLLGLSVGGTHVNVFLRCVLAEWKCSNVKLAKSGAISKVDMYERSSAIRDLVTSGMNWNVVHRTVAEEFPEVVTVATAYLNYRGTSEPTEWEGLRNLHNVAETERSWEKARRNCIAAKPFWAAWVRDMAAVAEQLTTAQVTEACSIVEACQVRPHGVLTSYAHLGANFFAAVGKANFKPRTMPRLTSALLVAQSLSPGVDIDESSKCAMLKSTWIAGLGKKDMVAKTNLVERMLTEFRAMASGEPDSARLVGEFELAIITQLFRKQRRIGTADSLSERAQERMNSYGVIYIEP